MGWIRYNRISNVIDGLDGPEIGNPPKATEAERFDVKSGACARNSVDIDRRDSVATKLGIFTCCSLDL